MAASKGELTSARERWEALVRSWRAGGQSQSAFCREHGLKLPTFQYWKQRLGSMTAGFVEVPLSMRERRVGEVFLREDGRLDIRIEVDLVQALALGLGR